MSLRSNSVVVHVLLLLLWVKGATECEFGLGGDGCTYQCHCQDDQECDPDTGTCPLGCDDGEMNWPEWRGYWSGPGCQTGNVAYGSAAEQGDLTLLSNVASRAVDGDHTRNQYKGHCAHAYSTGDGNPAWWQVDLGDSFVIYSINITNRNQDKDRLYDTLVEVSTNAADFVQDFDLCGDTGDDNWPDYVHVICTEPLIGRYVRIRRNVNAPEKHHMSLCEVMVYGYLHRVCDAGFYGAGCLLECHCSQPCHYLTGVCADECLPGWAAPQCDMECDDGEWGAGCVNNCHCQDPGEVCHKETGVCESGCAFPYMGQSCHLGLPTLYQAPGITAVESNSVGLHFLAWELSYSGEAMPTVYLIQYRENTDQNWQAGVSITETGLPSYTTELLGLAHLTTYRFRVLPRLLHEGSLHNGIASPETYPVTTLNQTATTPAPDMPTSSAFLHSVGFISGMCVLGVCLIVLTAAIVILVRGRRSCKDVDEVSPAAYASTLPNSLPAVMVASALAAKDNEKNEGDDHRLSVVSITELYENTVNGARNLEVLYTEKWLKGEDNIYTEENGAVGGNSLYATPGRRFHKNANTPFTAL